MNPNQPKRRRAESGPPETSPPCGPGPLLRDARLARRLDIGLAADQLKLRRDVLEAMERDDYSSLPEPIYLRGYLGSYARLLGLSEREVLQQFAAFKGETETEPAPLTPQRPMRRQVRSSDAKVRWFSYLVIAGMAAGIGWWSYERSSHDAPVSAFTADDPAPADSAGQVPAPAQVAETPTLQRQDTGGVDAPAGSREASEMDAAAVEAPSADPEPSVQSPLPNADPNAAMMPPSDSLGASLGSATAVEGEVAEPAIVASPAPEAPTAGTLAPPQSNGSSPTVASAGVDRLDLAFRRDCWLEVRDASGERLAFGLAKAGSSRELTGAAPFRILLGDSGGVDIRLNGDAVSPSVYDVGDGRPARFTLGETDSASEQG